MRLRRLAREVLPPDVPHVIDLIRRAHGAMVGCVVVPGADPIVSQEDHPPPETIVDRALELANVARIDRRIHIAREGSIYVAVGGGDAGACLVLAPGDEVLERPGEVAEDLRRWISELNVARARAALAFNDPDIAPAWYSAGVNSLESICFALAESVRRETGRAVAVATRDAELGYTTVVAVSVGCDRRLLGMRVKPGSAVGRACTGDVPVSGQSAIELFGVPRPERRRREEIGTAFPMIDGRHSVGAIIVFGPEATLTAQRRERVMWYAIDAGPRVAGAWAARAAESRTATDDLTKLANRVALERVLAGWATDVPCSLLVVELDAIEDILVGFGPVAKNAALRHLAKVVREALREDDVSAKLDGPRFAVGLPMTPFSDANLVAERIRSAVSTRVMRWGPADLKLSCSIGLAGMPETVKEPIHLLNAAEQRLEAGVG
jgi:diguanylate cyclase (GGDEF)-like protein